MSSDRKRIEDVAREARERQEEIRASFHSVMGHDPVGEKDRFYDRRRRQISFSEWAQLRSRWRRGPGHGYRRIAREQVGDLTISTVWDGKAYTLEKPAAIFETMVLGPECEDHGLWRWLTEGSARVGHAQIVAALRGEGDYPDDDREGLEDDDEWLEAQE